MLAVFVTLFLSIIPLNESKIFAEKSNRNEILEKCITDIIKMYFYPYKELTYYIDPNSDNQELIKTVNSINVISVISRTTKTKLSVPNESYLIAAGNIYDFNETFADIVREPSWSPQTRYLILIKNIQKEDLKFIFDVLLKFHIINVIVMSESDSLLYSYDPFDNYACGQRYDRIIEYGKCSESRHQNLYPYKLVTGLRNCTLRVKCVDWPPYSIRPTRNSTSVNFLGVEQYILNLLSVLESFNVNFFYSDDDGEMFTVIDKNMSAIGPLNSLQTGLSDVVLGGMLLTHQRSNAFDYIDGHFVENLRYIVKKASVVPAWKNLYLEFSAVVWITLLFSLIFYFLFFIIVVRPKDMGEVFLKILASLFLVSYRIKGSCFTKYLLIAWTWFAYLVNSYYQSNLVSLVTNPYMNYQISDEMDIIKYKLKPCISLSVREYALSVGNSTFEKNQNKDCDKLLKSMSTVGQHDDIYALTLNTIYTYHEHSFYDEKGNPMIFTFDRPLNKIILAIYVYKGFPLLEKLRIHTLRLNENGLIDNYLRQLYWKNNARYYFNENVRKSYITVPWYVLICGYSISLVIFVIEILTKWVDNRRTK